MSKYILFFITFLPHAVNADSVNEKIKKMNAGNELITSVSLSEKLEVEVIIDKTARGNGTLLIGNTLLKIKDSDAGDGTIYQGEYLEVFFHDVNLDGVKELIVSGIAKNRLGKGEDIGLSPVLFIYSYSVERNILLEVFRNSVVEIDLTK